MSHRPNSIHYEESVAEIGKPVEAGPLGVKDLKVTLDGWGPKNALLLMAMYVNRTWGEGAGQPEEFLADEWKHLAGEHVNSTIDMHHLNKNAQEMVERLLKGETLGQAKEMLSVTFTIENVSRASTHQITRTRVGAGFMQHGGRDNDWRHRPARIPITFKDLPPELFEQVIGFMVASRELYGSLVDMGVPWQDARYILPIGSTTHVSCMYNFQSLTGLLGNRLCHCMMWETNYIAQLMLKEIKDKMPAIFSKHLGAWCDKSGKCNYNGDLFPPCQKYPKEWNQEDYHHEIRTNPFYVIGADGEPIKADVGTFPLKESPMFGPEYYGHGTGILELKGEQD